MELHIYKLNIIIVTQIIHTSEDVRCFFLTVLGFLELHIYKLNIKIVTQNLHTSEEVRFFSVKRSLAF